MIRIQNRTTLVQQVPIAMPGDNEILVRIKTIAINPTDQKRACAPPSQPPVELTPTPSTDLKFICSMLTFALALHLHILTLFCADVGTMCGADYTGEVVRIGPRQDPNISLKVGDHVAGIIHGGDPGSIQPLTLFALPTNRCPQGSRCLC